MSARSPSERIFTWGQIDTRKYDILDTLKFAVNDDGIPYLCSEEQLKEAMFQAQKKVAEDRQTGGKTLAPFNPKYVVGKEGRKTIFDLPPAALSPLTGEELRAQML